MSGKGSKPRPLSVDQKTFDDNWDKIFKKDTWDHYSDLPNPNHYQENDSVLDNQSKTDRSSGDRASAF